MFLSFFPLQLFFSLFIFSGGSKGGARDARPRGRKFFQFHAVFGKIWQNRMLAPPRELAPPPRGNPGSVTDLYRVFEAISHHCYVGTPGGRQFEKELWDCHVDPHGNITISLLMNITMNQLGGASVIAKFHL